VYAQPDLFRASWDKQLDAAATEAISIMRAAGAPAPPVREVVAFLRAAERGKDIPGERPDAERTAIRETDASVFFESRTGAAAESWLHRSYIAK
jgi:hypothetical protein